MTASSLGQVEVNSALRFTNGLSVSPSDQPDNAFAGQIYFDKNTNTFVYHDGIKYQSLVGSESFNQLGALVRASAGSGLSLNGNALVNTGVLSLQGLAGNLNLAAGEGIAINGLAISLQLPQGLGTASSPAFASLTLGGPLSVGSGGSGSTATSFSTNGAVFYDGTKLVSTATPISSSCLVAVAGVPTFTTCPGSGASVDQITGSSGGSVAATGNLTFNNATTTSSAITIDNASTSVKGIASFNSAYFTTLSGAVSIANDAVALGANTTGNYLGSLTVGNGLAVSGTGAENATANVNLSLVSNKGLQADGSGLALINCATNEILKYNGSAQWACSADSTGTSTSLNTFSGAVTLQGTTNQVAVNNSSGTITLSTPQDINTTSAPTFAGLTVTSSASTLTSANLAAISHNSTYTSGASPVSGNSLNVNRSLTVNLGGGLITPNVDATPVTASYSATSSWASTSITVGSNANKVIIAHLVAAGGAPTVSAITIGGVTATQIRTYNYTTWMGTTLRVYDYYVKMPSSGSQTASITWSASATGTLALMSYKDVDQTTPIGTVYPGSGATACGASSCSTGSNIGTAVGDLVMGDILWDNDWAFGGPVSGISQGAGETQVVYQTPTANTGTGVSTKTATAGNASMTWNATYINSGGGIYGYAVKGVPSSIAVTGAAAQVTSNCTVVSGICTDTSNVLNVTQSYASATGAVLNIQNAGTGLDIQLGSGGIDRGTAGTISLGATTATAVNIGNGSGATAVSVLCGTGTCGFGNNATAHTTTAGSVTGASVLNLQAGTGGISLGNNAVANTIQIGNTTGAVAQTINIGNNATASSTNTIVIGSTIGTSPVTLQSGTSGVLVKGANTTTAFQVQNASSSPVLTVDTTNKYVGIGAGAGTPTSQLLVKDSGTVALNIATSTSTSGSRAYLGLATPGKTFTLEVAQGGAGNCADARLCFVISGTGPGASLDGSGNFRALGSITGSTTPDISETIPVTGDVGAADVVSADPDNTETAIKTSTPYDPTAIGVISDGTSAFKINSNSHDTEGLDTGKYLVLAGRVPVKVTDEGGPIKPGDYLTSSSTPGYAMKATHAGPTIGKSLGFFNGTLGTVMVQANLSYADPQPNLQGSNGLFGNLNVSGLATIQDLVVLGSANFHGNIIVGGHFVTNNSQGTTSASVDSNAGTGGAPSCVLVRGSDTSGRIKLVTGIAGWNAGVQCTLTFANAFSSDPNPVITLSKGSDGTTDSSAVRPYVDTTTTTMTINFGTADTAQHTYYFNYFNAQ